MTAIFIIVNSSPTDNSAAVSLTFKVELGTICRHNFHSLFRSGQITACWSLKSDLRRLPELPKSYYDNACHPSRRLIHLFVH